MMKPIYPQRRTLVPMYLHGMHLPKPHSSIPNQQMPRKAFSLENDPPTSFKFFYCTKDAETCTPPELRKHHRK
jgi:hypothetical protein